MSRKLLSLNVDSTGADYVEPASPVVYFPDGVDSSSVVGMNTKGMPVTPTFTGKYDPANTPNSYGTVQKNDCSYKGLTTRIDDDTMVCSKNSCVLVKKADAITYDAPLVPAHAKFDDSTVSVHYRVGNNSRGRPSLYWRPAVRIYTQYKHVSWVEVYAKVYNNTGEVLQTKNFSVTLTGNSTASQHDVEESRYESTRYSIKAMSASVASMAPAPAVEMSTVGETQKFTLTGSQDIPCGESVHKLYEIRDAGIKTQCFHYFYNPMTNTTQYGYAMTFDRFMPAASVNVVDYSFDTITNLGSRDCGSATPGSRYTVIVGGSVQYSPKVTTSTPTFEADSENHGYYRKTSVYKMRELNEYVIIRVPKSAIESMKPEGVLDVDSGNYELYVRDLKVTELEMTIVNHGYCKKL